MKHKCDVCQEDFEDSDPNLQSCYQCQRVINKYNNGSKRKKYSPTEVRSALKNAYSNKENGYVWFRCEYTGIVGKFNHSSKTLGHFDDPFVLTLDHKYPNQKELVVCLNIINKMKGDIPPKKFKEIVLVLGDFFRTEKETKSSEKLEHELREICH